MPSSFVNRIRTRNSFGRKQQPRITRVTRIKSKEKERQGRDSPFQPLYLIFLSFHPCYPCNPWLVFFSSLLVLQFLAAEDVVVVLGEAMGLVADVLQQPQRRGVAAQPQRLRGAG